MMMRFNSIWTGTRASLSSCTTAVAMGRFAASGKMGHGAHYRTDVQKGSRMPSSGADAVRAKSCAGTGISPTIKYDWGREARQEAVRGPEREALTPARGG